MTHVYRVNCQLPITLNYPDSDCNNPFAATGPLEMYEHIFELEQTDLAEKDPDAEAEDMDSDEGDDNDVLISDCCPPDSATSTSIEEVSY